MEKMTVKQYAELCGISVAAAHKRINVWVINHKKYPEIKKIEAITNKFFILKVNTGLISAKKCNNVAKINLVETY